MKPKTYHSVGVVGTTKTQDLFSLSLVTTVGWQWWCFTSNPTNRASVAKTRSGGLMQTFHLNMMFQDNQFKLQWLICFHFPIFSWFWVSSFSFCWNKRNHTVHMIDKPPSGATREWDTSQKSLERDHLHWFLFKMDTLVTYLPTGTELRCYLKRQLTQI